ncbi:MAG: hypothetical protein BMS9Abin05_0206 [Rhodothermia bacterium]|nr:MAG: hypothetical protein BMS9Abin05_0206 [Rhodothermia bacterium]
MFQELARVSRLFVENEWEDSVLFFFKRFKSSSRACNLYPVKDVFDDTSYERKNFARQLRALTIISFDILVKRYRHRVYGFAYHYLVDEDEAADVTQDVFVRMWQNRVKIDEERVLGWLLRVTRNACVDSVRKKNAYRRRVETDSDAIIEQADRAPLPDHQASASLFNERLTTALNKLDEPYKSIIILREIQEYKYGEIGEALDLPLNTVKVYLHRARKELRKELSEDLRYEYI